MNSQSKNGDDAAAWFCVRTQPKRENLAAKTLDQIEGVESFCPRLRYRKATRRGKIWWVEAMFPGYIFAHFSRGENARAVLHSQGVMTLLKFGDYIPAIPAEFVEELRQTMADQNDEHDGMLTLQPTVKEGDEVEIAHGAMQGIKGKVVEILPAKERVNILIEFLGEPQVVDTDLFSLLLPNKPLPGV